MGFFKNLVKKIGRGIGRGIEIIGDIFGSGPISDAGRWIQDKCAETVGSTGSYEKSIANIHTTEQLSNTLAEMSEGYLEKAAAVEERCIEIVKGDFNELIATLKATNGLSGYNARLKQLEREQSRIAKMISGGIREPLAQKLSIDNHECCEILKMDAGSEKVQAMKSFANKAIRDSLNNLAEKVREAFDDIIKDVSDFLSNIAEEQENGIRNARQHFDKFVNQQMLEQNEIEDHCVLPLLVIDASDQIMSILT